MFIIANFLDALSTIVDFVLSVYMWIILISAVLSWVNPDPYNPIVRTIRSLTEPIYSKIRRFIPTVYGNIDFAPVITILIIMFLKIFLVETLHQLASKLY